MPHDRSLWVLGISASHNGAACLLRGAEIVVAIQEERLSRVKRHRIYGAEPLLCVPYCLDYAGITPDALRMVVISAQGRARDEHHDISANPLLKDVCRRIPTLFIPHHYAHAVSAFALSGFKESAILVVDGMGSPEEDLFKDERRAINKRVEDGWETISLYQASGTSVTAIEKHMVARGAWLSAPASGMPRFRSLGGMFSAVAKQVFSHDMEAGKVMGLAPYGKPHLTSGFFEISNDAFIFLDQVPKKFLHDDRWPARRDEYRDLASSVQAALENALFHLLRRLRNHCASENLCYAGGVALNSVANERIIRESGFKRVFIPPAAEDSGPAIGAAYHGLWRITGENSHRAIVHDACGRLYSSRRVSAAVKAAKAVRSIRSADTISDAASLLRDGKIIGWFDGRSELGPRALGQRSIICDPRQARHKELLNRKVKKREPFRPFAPAILLEEVRNWFDLDGSPPESPFMLRVCRFSPERRDLVPAVVHVDGTGRLQTVCQQANGRFYQLVGKFYEQTGVPILLNTSFNVAGEPLVETPEDAIACLLNTELDCCIFEDQIVFKHVHW